MKKLLVLLLVFNFKNSKAQSLSDIIFNNSNGLSFQEELKKNEYVQGLCADCKVFGNYPFLIENGYKSMFHRPNDYAVIAMSKPTKHLDTNSDKVLDSELLYVFYTDKSMFDQELKYLEETQSKKDQYFYSKQSFQRMGKLNNAIITTIKWPTIHQSIRYGFRIIIYPSH